MSIPYVIECDEKDREKTYDLFSRLLKDRIIFIRGEITPESADVVVAQLLFLETNNPEKDIYMYISSPGGHIDGMYSIYDTMNYIKPDVVTLGMGSVSSAASFLLSAGKKGKRFALPNTTIMIHELSSGFSGKFKDMRNKHLVIEKLHEKLSKQMADLTGQSVKKIKKDTQLDYYMTAEEAKEYGIIDAIQYSRG